MLIDRLALGLGLVLTPLFALAKFDLALLIGGVAGGHDCLCRASLAGVRDELRLSRRSVPISR